MLHLCPLSYQKPTSSTGAEASGWGEHICLHDGCLAHHLKPQLYCWRWFSRFGRMVVKIDSRSWASCQKLLPASAAPGDFCPPSLSLELSPPSTAPVCAGLWGPCCTGSAIIPSKPSVALVTQPLGLLWPATECEECSSQPSSLTGNFRRWTLWRKDFWFFFSFGAKESRLIKTNGLREVLAAASHIGFIDWILFSLGFQIFLSYYFSCHILNCFLLYTHCLCLPFGKTFLQSYTSSVQ